MTDKAPMTETSISEARAVTIVALIALPEEYDVFCTVFPYRSDRSTERMICVEHDSSNSSVRLISVLAEQMGAQSASESAEHAISELQPDLVVVIGIAGGVSSDLQIGDVCVSNQIFDVLHNNKVATKAGANLDISFAPEFYHVNADLVSAFTFLKSHPLLKPCYAQWREDCRSAANGKGVEEGSVREPIVHIAPIACGPVSATSTFNAKLRSLHRKVAAIETESGGIFRRIEKSGIPGVAVRGISDMADDKKAALEDKTGGKARELAMRNASALLKVQLQNDRFLRIAQNQRVNREQPELFTTSTNFDIVSRIDDEIKTHLAELSPDFKSRPEGFYLPVPRAKRITYTEDIAEEGDFAPENVLDCLAESNRIVVRLSRSFPGQSLGWALAHSLLRHSIGEKVVLPYVVSGTSIRPPKSGLLASIPHDIRPFMLNKEFERVLIIEEPCFESRSRLRYLSEEIKGFSGRILVITKAEDNVASTDAFIKENAFVEYDIAPVSFSETAFFLERAFSMSAPEAEAVAIRLDDTFRKFRLEAHPTYFAGLQEETLAALINANKRAELIQLAVDGLLSLMVAADDSRTNLSRTTRESFLRRVVLKMAKSPNGMSDDDLSEMASEFIAERRFDLSQTELLAPFFKTGLIYRAGGIVVFSHPYLRSYLLAQSLRENPDEALGYFSPDRDAFDYYAFDLYCELGPDAAVIDRTMAYADSALEEAHTLYPHEHVFLEPGVRLAALSSTRQLSNLTSSLSKTARRLEQEDGNDDLRAEKQRILDARRHVRTEVVARAPTKADDLPEEVAAEFRTLEALWRSLTLCTLAIGSGAEALDGKVKARLTDLTLRSATKFSDVWTRNRLRINFDEARQELLSDESIWRFVEEFDLEQEAFALVRKELEMAIHGAELNAVLDPMGRVLWRVSASAGVKVLAPILKDAVPVDPMARIFRASWMMDVDSAEGKDAMKAALSAYKGSGLLRLVLANHLLWRVYWHHYKTSRARHFIAEAKRALGFFGLSPSDKRIEEVKRGPAG